MGQGMQTCWTNRTSDPLVQWTQLKKDYVPGYGDTIDLVVIAGSWEKDRARELRGRYCPGLVRNNTSQSALVPPSTLTRFYIGAFGNSSQCAADVSFLADTRPSKDERLLVAHNKTPFCCLFHCLLRPVPGTARRVQLLRTSRRSRAIGENTSLETPNDDSSCSTTRINRHPVMNFRIRTRCCRHFPSQRSFFEPRF